MGAVMERLEKSARAAAFALALLTGGTVLTSCTVTQAEQGVVGVQLTDKHWLSVRESSYSAADRLVAQARENGFLKPGMPIVSTTLTNVNRIGKSSGLGRIVADQVGSRFTQRGQPVTEIRLREGVRVVQDDVRESVGGEYMLSRDTAALVRKAKASGILTGTYAVGKDSVFISLRLVAATTGKVVAAYDYSVYMTDDVKALTRDEEDRRTKFFNE